MKDNPYIPFLLKYFNGDALLWVVAYGLYVHSVDDIIDNEIPAAEDKHQFVLQTFEYAEAVYTNNYYLANITRLRPLVKMASSAYMTSVQLEKSNEPHHKIVADHLRSQGNEVMLAVVEIEHGSIIRQQASLELRAISYKTHHNELGQPV